MSVTQSATGTSGAGLARFSGVTGAPNLRTGTYSMACRVKWGTAATNVDMMLMTLTIQSDGRGLYLQRRNGDAGTVVIAYRYDGFATFNTANITGAYGSTTAWVHIGVTYDGTTIRTYVNGVASGTVASSSTLIASGTGDAISALGPTTGEVADCVMFSRALTAAEMKELAVRRVPTNRRADCFAWWPMTDPSSLTNAGLDYSGRGNHATLVNSGANNPAAAHGAIPIAWNGQGSRLVLPQLVVNNATAAGTTNVTGAASAGASAPASGLTQITGAASAGASAPASGLTQVTGTTAPRASAPASGLTQVTGVAIASLSTQATGTTNVTGTATGSPAGSASGLTQVTGSTAPAASAPASGLTQTFASTSPSAGAPATGLTQTTGAGAASANGSFSGTASGTTQTTGAAAASVSGASSAGATQVTGTAVAGIVYSLSAAGMTSVSGAAGQTTLGASASGLTQTTGAAAASSNQPSGPALGNRQAVASRRWMGATKTRRALRR